MMKMELDVESVYYFVWSIAVLIFLGKTCEVLDRMTDLLHTISRSRPVSQSVV